MYHTTLGHFPLWYIRTLSKMVHIIGVKNLTIIGVKNHK